MSRSFFSNRIFLLFTLVLGKPLALADSGKFLDQRIPELAPLLTPGYGVVGEKEQREQAGKGGLAWLCLKLDKVTMKCEDNGYDLDETPPRTKLYFNVLQVVSGNSLYDFNLRQVMDLENCRLTHRRWKRVLSAEKVACFSAYPYEEEKSEDAKFKQILSWIQLDRIKSRKAEWTFFIQYKP